MPKPHPQEFRDDVIAVARKGEAPNGQIAKDFGISESCLRNWLAKADRADAPAGDNRSAAELREARNASGCWNRKTRSCVAPRPIYLVTSTQNDASMPHVKAGIVRSWRKMERAT